MDEFDAIAAELRADEQFEHEEHARELLAAADEVRGFDELLRRVSPGEVVALSTLDGAVLRGRIVRVGRDWVRLAEVADELGSARARTRRVHDVRIAAVGRISRESNR